MGIIGGPPIGGVGSMPGRGGPPESQTANECTMNRFMCIVICIHFRHSIKHPPVLPLEIILFNLMEIKLMQRNKIKKILETARGDNLTATQTAAS